MRKVNFTAAIFLYVLLFATTTFSQQYKWKVLPNAPVSPARFEDTYFIDPSKGWVIHNVDSNGVSLPNLYKTTDGGVSWISLSDSSFGQARSIGFANANTGWIGTYLFFRDTIGIYSTTNGGQSWYPQLVGSRTDSLGICGLSVLNENYVFGCGTWYGPAKFYKTTNGGLNWTVKDMSAYARRLIDCYFVSPDSGYLVGGINTFDSSRGVVLFTSDGGETWVNKITTPNLKQWGWKISFPSRNIGYVSLERFGTTGGSYFLKTTDGGVTWSEYTVFSNLVLDQEGIGFANETTGWLGGWWFNTYKTTNGGQSWVSDPWGFNVNRFRFFGDTLGFAVGKHIYKYELDTTIGIHNISTVIPNSPELSQNYPNPFNPTTKIKFHVLDYEDTKLTVFDVLGREIAVLVNEKMYPGIYEYTFDASDLQSGVYFYKIETLRYSETKRMVLVK